MVGIGIWVVVMGLVFWAVRRWKEKCPPGVELFAMGPQGLRPWAKEKRPSGEGVEGCARATWAALGGTAGPSAAQSRLWM